MASIRNVKKVKRIVLEDDGILSNEIQHAMHDQPTQLHYDRAAESVGGLDRNAIPTCATLAELLVFVVGVKAVGGNDAAAATFLDRMSPKAARANTAVDVNVSGMAAPVASSNSAEQEAATSFYDALKVVKSG